MSKQTKVTKAGNLSQAFKAAAATNPEGALAYMFLSAFGISLDVLCGLANRIAATKDVQMVWLALAASVQIRAHAVFVGTEYAGIRTKYPELIIDGQREQADQFNYGALHALGHVLCHVATAGQCRLALAKAGSCITGAGVTESEAGKVNKEVAGSWTQANMGEFSNWLATDGRAVGVFVDSVMVTVDATAGAFAKSLTQPSAPRPVPKAPGAPATSSAT